MTMVRVGFRKYKINNIGFWVVVNVRKGKLGRHQNTSYCHVTQLCHAE